MKLLRWSACLLAVLAWLCGAAFPQSSSTSLHGAITDPSGSAIVGANVVLSNDATKLERTTTTGSQGDFQFLALSPGTYTLSVNAKGFKKYQQTALQLLVNTPATVNVALVVGATTENVTVTSEAPVLNMDDASLGNPFNETQVKAIPLEGRNVPDLLSLQAGVAYTGNRPDIDKDQDTRNGSVNGARSDQSNVTLDGVDVNDQAHGYAFQSVLPVTLDSVQEFRVTTTNYNADQGDGSGAQVALVTKSGTNNFHGSLYEYHRNTITSANDWFVKGAQVRSGTPNEPDKLLRNIFGVSLGGPMKKDRLFFFVNYEGTRQREQESTIRSIPTYVAGGQGLCQGYLRYNDVNGGVTTLSPTDIANLDAYNLSQSAPTGLSGYNNQSPGINVNILDLNAHGGYWDKTYCTGQFITNDTSVGDGLNYSGFRFRAPVSLNNNAFIARLDYHLDAAGKNTLFWRGALQNLSNPQAPFLPGSAPEQTVVDHSKGFVVGLTSVLRPTMVNSFHWGFTRQSSGVFGNPAVQKNWNLFYGLDQGVVYSHYAQTPSHNVLDDFSWTKGRHTLQFGTNIGFARDPRVSYEHSFSVGKGGTNWMAPTGFSNTVTSISTGSPLDPFYIGKPEPVSSPQYDYPMLGLLGMVSDLVRNTNYDKSGANQAEGDPVKRKYGLNWYEFYGQDTWRMKPNLTLTYGLRWSLFPPPWEVNGFQASPTCIVDPVNGINTTTGCPSWAFNAGTEFNQMVKLMNQGQGYVSVPLVSFILAGPGNHGPGVGPGFYHFEKSDFSPRVSFAYSPRPEGGWLKKLFGENDKTVIRGGFGKVYDRSGMQLLSTFDANAPGGLSSTVQNPCCYLTDPATFTYSYDTANGSPRITDVNTVPTYTLGGVQIFPDPPPGQFPQTPANGSQAITWGVDQSMQTPYSYTFDFSVARELPGKFGLQFAYVGRLGRRLLTQRDLRQPLDLVDPNNKSLDYYKAATRLSQLARQGVQPNTVTDSQVGPTAQYWHDMLGPLNPSANGYVVYFSSSGCVVSVSVPSCVDTDPTNGLVQSVYGLFTGTGAYAGNEVVGLGNIDLYYYLSDDQFNYYFFNGPPGGCVYGSPTCNAGEMLNNQLTTQYAWSSIGKSNYNALQASLRKQFARGLQFDLNYTYSKSIDITSSATRLGFSSSTNVGAPGTRLVNAFNPRGRRGVSDFDTTHQFNADWTAELPFGRGRHFAPQTGNILEAFIGGWELSGLARWTSGFPFTVDNGNYWPTDWDEQGIAQMVVRPKTGHFVQPDGTVSVFANPKQVFDNGNFIHPFPGGSGSRNVIRGDGFAGLDMALNKRWKMPIEGHSLQFRWEVFNVPNLHRFNVLSGLGTQACACIASLQQVDSNFGDYTGLLTQPRVMQFALRYEF